MNYNLNIHDVLPHGAWKGKRCFIVGGGPSLKGFDWGLLQGELSIGVNRAFEKYDPTIMFCMDPGMWGWIVSRKFGPEVLQRYNEFKGYKVWTNNIWLNIPPEDNTYIADVKNLMPCGSNSGHSAINLAVLLGASPIYLLGFDMKGDGKGRQKWWHDGYPTENSEQMYSGFITAMTKDAPRLLGEAEVVNLNPNSALKCFPFDTIQHIFRRYHARSPIHA